MIYSLYYHSTYLIYYHYFYLLKLKGDTPGTTLTHLLFQTLEPLHDITEYDSALQKRVNSTQQIVSHLVEAVEKERANNERITALLRGTRIK